MMRYDRKAAAIILVAAIILLLSTSLYITPTSVSDADPSTYVIVPTLMLPLFVLFCLKTRPEPQVGKKDVAVGLALLAAFIAANVALRLYFGIFFISFRIDMLLMPLAVASLVSILFGMQNVRKFRGAIIYSLLASPVVLYPFLALFNLFTQFNSLLVYLLIKPFISSVRYIAPISIVANGYTIGIGEACVGIGIFIALALFLIPVAYFYNGPARKKALWVASGVILLFVLNLARMLGVSLAWFAYGPNATTLYVHSFVGVLLFYVAIVAMMLIAGFYGLRIAKPKKIRKRRTASTSFPFWALEVVLAFCVIYIFVTLNYSSSMQISPIALSNKVRFNYSNTQISTQIKNQIAKSSFTSFVIATENGSSALYTLLNSSINSTNPILLFYTQPNSNTVAGLASHNTLIGQISFFNREGTREQVFDLISNSTEYAVYNTDFPFVLSNMSTEIAGVYVIIPANHLPPVYSCSTYDQLYSGLLSIATPSGYNQTTRQNLLAAECFADRLVWT